MKILFYIDFLGRTGGAQKVMYNLILYFNKMRYEVIVVNDWIMPEQILFEMPVAIKHYYLQNKMSSGKVVRNYVRIIELRKIVQKEMPDTVVSFLGGNNIRMLLSTFGMKNTKIVSVRNVPSKEYGNNIIVKILVGMVFRLADVCVLQTKEAMEYFPKNVKKKSVIILNPISMQFYNIKRSENIKNIISVGRLEAQKNYKLLIEAYARIKDECLEDKLIIYGEGSMRQELTQFIEELNLQDSVLLPGNVSDIEERLASAKIFVLSSNYEGLPNALMEAMAAGVPCISTDCPCGGPRQLFGENGNIGLVECGNVEELSNELRLLLKNGDLRNDLGIIAKKRAELFAPDKILEQWETVCTGNMKL